MDVPTPSNDDPASLVSIPQASPDYESGSSFNIHLLPTSHASPFPRGTEYISAKVLNPVLSPQPRPSRISDAITPPAEFPLDDLALAAIAAPALPPTEPVQRPSLAKSLARNLRLPSFEVLGIATPHPDRLVRGQEMSGLPNSGPLSHENFDIVFERHQCSSAAGELTPNPSPPDRPTNHSARPEIQSFVLGPNPSEAIRPEGEHLASVACEETQHLGTEDNVVQQAEGAGSGSSYSIPSGASESLWIAV